MGLFGWNGQYIGEFIPRSSRKSGNTVAKQSKSYNNDSTRKRIAKEMVRSSVHNMRRNVMYYDDKRDLVNSPSMFENISLKSASTIQDVLGVEAQYRKMYYENITDILKPDCMVFNGRTYQPPEDRVNALLSFGNSLLYSVVVDEIYKTGLDPTVSYLHEPGERRNSLSLDIADIFKPVLVDRTIFRIVNRGQIDKDDFEQSGERVYLGDQKELFVDEFESTLDDTVAHPTLERNVSHQYLIRLDLYRLQKDVVTEGDECYEGFKRWW
jgi:CRISPR-associated protein Cas1